MRPTPIAPFAIAFAAFLHGACPTQDGVESEPAATAGTTAQAVNAFAVDLLHALEGGGNACFSPYSVHVALAMTRTGAAGETAVQMDRVLHLTDAVRHRTLREALAPRDVQEWDPETRKQVAVAAYRMNVANRIWGQKGIEFLEPFVTGLVDGFDAPLGRVDFARGEPVRSEINGWVAEQTADKIPELIPSGAIGPATSLVLVNAIHLVASWRTAFPEGATVPKPFAVLGGEPIEVPTMHVEGAFGYASDDTVEVLELPYRADLSMVIVLPRGDATLAAVEATLTHDVLDGWLSGLASRQIAVALPRFKLRSQFGLHDVLPGMGMPDAFDATRADFSGMSNEKMWIDLVLHQGFIAVDEKGTEAAAATAVIMKRLGRPPEAAMTFKVDRPFLFALRHQPSGCLLFVGRVVDPRG